MSDTARWSYANVAQVRPYMGVDDWGGGAIYGPEYLIACTWSIEATQFRDSNGAEFVSRNIVYTEDLRPKRLDMIRLRSSVDPDAFTQWEEIRDRTEWDMSFFTEVPDVRLVT